MDTVCRVIECKLSTKRVSSQRAHHGQTTLKQRCINVIYVEITLFQRRLTMNCPLGYGIRYQIPNESSNREQRYEHPLYGWACIKKVLYADDMVMFFKTKEALQEGLEIIESVLSRYGLTLSQKKTETMVVSDSPDEIIQESIVHVGDYKIKNVSEFCYLGILISSVNPSRIVEHRIASASAKFAELKHMLQDQRINLKTRSLYMNAFIRSRLT